MRDKRFGTLLIGAMFFIFAATHLGMWIGGYPPRDWVLELISIVFWVVLGAATIQGYTFGRTIAEAILWLTVMSGIASLLWSSGMQIIDGCASILLALFGAIYLRSIRKVKKRL